MLLIGLTGGIGSGKSTVARLFGELGAETIDADALAREATRDPAVLARLEKEFGSGVLRDGQLDRAALAGLVFTDGRRLRQLNGIIHPWVRERSRELRERYRAAGARVVVEDIPLLYESGLEDRFDYVVAVTAPLQERIARVRERSGLQEQEIRQRDAAQLPLADKVARADFVINNSGSLAELRRQVEKTWGEFT